MYMLWDEKGGKVRVYNLGTFHKEYEMYITFYCTINILLLLISHPTDDCQFSGTLEPLVASAAKCIMDVSSLDHRRARSWFVLLIHQ